MPGVRKIGSVFNFCKALRTAAFLDQGVITAFLLVTFSAASLGLGAVFLGLQALMLQERIVAAVDLAALAAADTHRGLVSGQVCENAESILKTVDAVMTTCRIVGLGVMVSGQLSFPPMTLKASATAGER